MLQGELSTLSLGAGIHPVLPQKRVCISSAPTPAPFGLMFRSKLELYTNGKLELEGMIASTVFETNYKPEQVKPP